MQTELPKDFVRLMHEHYDSATADALCHALDATEPEVSIRLNPYKLSADEVLACNAGLEPVPWCPNAFYLPGRPPFTFDPLLHAGAYYVQEASSMYAAHVLSEELRVKSEEARLDGRRESQRRVENDSKNQNLQNGNSDSSLFTLRSSLLALDLCAAPGGKSTLLHSLLPEGSVLISNEPVAKRAQVLAENMQKWTRGLPASAPRSIVTQNYPQDFGILSGQVDILLADVPCSGEGMFRKDEVARQEWSLENVEMCRQRQRDILSDIWHVLKPGGLLIYSTCTFNRFEDEDNVRWICEELGGELLSERHFLPGRDRGEGFYVAKIRVKNEERRVKSEERRVKNEEARLDGRRESQRRVKDDSKNQKLQSGNSDFSLFTFHFSLQHVLYDSAEAPQLGGGCIELSYSEALQYLRREALRVEAPRGPVTLCYRGLVLGQGKGVGSRINNLYPEPWRIRTTYTTPFSLLGTD